jgi:hypothetical protein
MKRQTQISAMVSPTTKDLLERHVRATGVKKGHLLEEALRHHLQALHELPADVIVHPRIVVSLRSGRKIVARITSRRRPTRKLRKLMAGDGD